MSIIKRKASGIDVVKSILEFDEVPTEGSHNLLESGSVAQAIGNLGQPLQWKGPATVSELNTGISGIQPGWTYTLTDAGTLTDGSVAVDVGDEVAWTEDDEWFQVGPSLVELKADVVQAKSDIADIQDVVPEEASESNKLVTKDELDNVQESIQSGFTPKGEISVSDLNDLTTQSNGDQYILTDSGTITDGSVTVEAGDSVAWNSTNSVWYKVKQYALSKYGTDEIKNLPTTITSFRTGDVIPVDGPSGTAKMSKDDLLARTAENALGSIRQESQASKEGVVSGNHLAYDENGAGKKLPLLYLPSNAIVGATADRLPHTTGTVRNFIEYNFKKGKTYTIQIFTSGLSSYSGGTNMVVVKTCVSEEDYTNILDNIIEILPSDYGKQITTKFTPSVDSNTLYIFVNATSNNGFIDIRVSDDSETTSTAILEDIEGTPLTFKIDASNLGKPVRNFAEYSFKAGHSYKVSLDITGWGRQHTSWASMLGLYTISSPEDYANKIDFIFEISNAESIAKRTLDFIFTATSDAEYLYIYTICGSLGGVILGSITDAGISLELGKIEGKGVKTLCYAPVPNGMNRQFKSLKLKRNHTYEFEFRLYDLSPATGSTDILKVCLLNDTSKYAAPDVTLLKLRNGDVVQTSYKVKFTSPSDFDYIYVFSNALHGFYLAVDVSEQTTDGDILVVKNESHNYSGSSYNGPRIELNSPVFGASILTTLQKSQDAASLAPQGFAAYGNYLFRLYHTGVVDVYLKSDYSLVGSFRLGSYDDQNHANSACFIYGKYAQGNTDFPLLLVTTGNAPETMTAAVENITLTNGVWSSEVVQTFSLDQSGFAGVGLTPYWGWPCWFAEGQRIYLHGTKYRTNGSEQAHYSDNRYIITEFELPDLNTMSKTFTASDAIKQTLSEYDVNATQGGTIYNGKIIYTFGFGSVAFPNAIRVWDAPTGALINKVDLSFYSGEIEACSVIDGVLLVSFDDKLVRLNF